MRRPPATLLLALLLFAALSGCGDGGASVSALPAAPDAIELTSSAFAEGAPIPASYTCDGSDLSPPLKWSGVPKQAQSLAVMVADPDAPGGSFVHWTLFDVDPTLTRLAAGSIVPGSTQGSNDFGQIRYQGPCPPKGDKPHHYEFAVYALQQRLNLPLGAAPGDVGNAIAKLALARGTLHGTFGR
jgi:Raf kinase inhibitor-like YbhB/YbcL family protein